MKYDPSGPRGLLVIAMIQMTNRDDSQFPEHSDCPLCIQDWDKSSVNLGVLLRGLAYLWIFMGRCLHSPAWLAWAGCSDLSPPILTCFYHILNDWKIFARHLESRLHTTFTFRKLHTSEIESKETHQRNAPCCLFSLRWETWCNM